MDKSKIQILVASLAISLYPVTSAQAQSRSLLDPYVTIQPTTSNKVEKKASPFSKLQSKMPGAHSKAISKSTTSTNYTQSSTTNTTQTTKPALRNGVSQKLHTATLKLKDGSEAVGSKTLDAMKTVGHGIKSGGKKVVSETPAATKALGNGIASTGRSLKNGTVWVGKEIAKASDATKNTVAHLIKHNQPATAAVPSNQIH